MSAYTCHLDQKSYASSLVFSILNLFLLETLFDSEKNATNMKHNEGIIDFIV